MHLSLIASRESLVAGRVDSFLCFLSTKLTVSQNFSKYLSQFLRKSYHGKINTTLKRLQIFFHFEKIWPINRVFSARALSKCSVRLGPESDFKKV